jgi:hypothetical protein
LVVLVLLVAVGALVLLANLGAVAADRGRARAAADAAALAAATEPDHANAVAGVVAGRNGGVVEAVSVDGDQVEVTVRVGRARATSRAAAAWVPAAAGPAGEP